MISGSSNGEIFVWNTLSGIVLQKLVKDDAREVVGILGGKDRIFSAGWDGKLVSFKIEEDVDISKCPVYIPEDRKWDPHDKHTDDRSPSYSSSGRTA